MLSLQETTVHYMHQQFQPELFTLLVDCCTTLGCFAVSQFEDDLINLLAAAEDMHTDEVRDQFVSRIRQALMDAIEEHFIKIDKEATPTLAELNELAKAIFCIQDLDDMSAVEYRVNGLGTAKQILIDLMKTYGQLNQFRAMEIIADVDTKLIQAMQLMAQDKAKEPADHSKHATTWRNFTRFLGKDAPCLGLTFKQNGYFGLTFKEMVALVPTSIPAYIDKVAPEGLPQAALDLLSVMMLCTDTYEDPIASLGEHTSDLLSDATHLGQIKKSMNDMYIDFNNWLQAHKPGLSTQQDIVQ